MQDGQEVVFHEDSEPIIDGEAGDLRFCIRTAPHDLLRRESNGLHLTVTIKLAQALVVFKKTVKHLDDHLVDITSKGSRSPRRVGNLKWKECPFILATRRVICMSHLKFCSQVH